MQSITLVSITQNQLWETYAWYNEAWSELVGCFETEVAAEHSAARYAVPILRGATTPEIIEHINYMQLAA